MSDDRLGLIVDAVGRLEAGLNEVRGGLNEVRGGLNEVRGGLGELRGGLGELRADFDQLRTAQERLRVDLMARMDRLQAAITLQRDENIVHLGAGERAEKIALGTREEVRVMGEQINIMIRQIRRLDEGLREIRGDP